MAHKKYQKNPRGARGVSPLAYLASGGVLFHRSQLGVDSLDVILHLTGGFIDQVAESGKCGAQLLLHL